MIKAVDQDGKTVNIDSVDPSLPCYCPICGKLLIQKRGQIRQHHFAHLSDRGTDSNDRQCSDRWRYDKTDWHIEWQKRFPEECYEVVMTNGNQKHIADIAVNNTVIEFQHSPISIDEFRDRNQFFASCGYSVVWVFDLMEEYSDQKIKCFGEQFRWSYPKKLFRNMDLHNENVTVYFQLLYDETVPDEEQYVVERVSNAYRNFTSFYTDARRSFSVVEFVQFAILCPKKIIVNKRPNMALPVVPGGKTILQLWNDDYSGMVVRRITDGKEMVINGNLHGPYRQDHNPKGKIIGKSSYVGSDGRYNYSSQYDVVWDAEKPIWELKKPFFHK